MTSYYLKNYYQIKKDDYTHYVIIPHFIESSANAYEIINAIPKEKLLLLDKLVPGVTGEYAAAYENFEKDIYDGLTEAIDQLSKYHTLKIIFPEHSYYPPEILIGLKTFARIMLFPIKLLAPSQKKQLMKERFTLLLWKMIWLH